MGLTIRCFLKAQHYFGCKYFCSPQACYRGWRTRREINKIKGTLLIQSSFRKYAQQRKHLRTTQAVVKMQAMVRRRICVMKYHKLRTACIFIQRRIRANRIARKLRQEFILTRCAVIKIQSCYRGWKVRNESRRFKAACKIQRWYRSILEARKVRQEYCRIVKATAVLQAAYRGYSARLYARKMKAARTIQEVVMVYLARKNMEAQALARRNACILLQRRIRANSVARKLRKEFIVTRWAVIKIQSCYRGLKVRNEIRRFKDAFKMDRYQRWI